MSQHLARLPVLVPDRLPEVVDLVAQLSGEIQHGDMVLHDLAEKQCDTLHRQSALILVDRITPDAPTPWFGDIKGRPTAHRGGGPRSRHESRVYATSRHFDGSKASDALM